MSDKMLCLSVRQPWAWLILHGGKDIENRTWPTKFRGRVLLHAAKGMTEEEYVHAARFAAERGVTVPGYRLMLRGGIMGSVQIVGCVTEHKSVWFEGPHGFVLRDQQPLPWVPCRGALGFFPDPRP